MLMPAPDAVAVRRRKAPWWRWGLSLVGVGLLVWVVARLDPEKMLAVLAQLPATALFGAAVSFTVNLVLKTVRWRRLLDAEGIHLGWGEALASYLVGAFYGSVTVGRVGEFMRIDVLLARSVPFGRALAASLFDRVEDLATLALVGAASAAWLAGRAALAWGLVLAGVGGVLVSMVSGRLLGSWSGLATPRTVSSGRMGRLVYHLRVLAGEAPTLLRPAVLMESLVWTAVTWAAYCGTVWFLARGLIGDVPLLYLVAAPAISALATLLPVTYQGIGVRELVFATVLGHAGVEREHAVVLSMSMFAVMFVVSVAWGLAAMAVRRFDARTLPR